MQNLVLLFSRHLYGLVDDEHNGEGEVGPDYSAEQSLSDDCADQVSKRCLIVIVFD
jgi:hypothetical protein